MSTLTVNLSAALQTTLGQPGVYAWAVPFYTEANAPSSTMATPVALVDNGTIQDSGTIEIDLGSSFPAGKVYFIIQSVDPGASEPIAPLTFGTGGTIENEADINWNSASTYDFRYDSFEVTISGSAGDDGNLTDVVSFGIPMSVEVEYPNGAPTQTRGYAVNGSTIFSDISGIEPQAVYTYTQGPLAGLNRMAASPATALTTPGIVGPTASDWNAYVESLGAQSASEVRIAGFFNGAPSVEYTTYNNTTYSYNEYHNPGFYSYRLKWVPGTDTAGTYVFTPEANSQIQGTISISSADLANSIYSTLGNATVAAPDGTQYQFSSSNGTSSPDMNTGANNQWGAFFVQLLTGFTGGYLGGTTTPLTSLLGSGPISLSHNWNFDPTFAFGGSIASGPGAVTPWSWNTTTYGSGVPYDAYAGVFFNSSNSYGNQYSDALMSLFQQGGPLIPVGYTSGGVQANVPNINLTLYDDNEAAAPGQTLAETQQYTSPVIYDVSDGPYVTPLTGDGSGTNPTPLSLILDFQLGQMRLDPDATVKFGFYTGQQNGLAQFQYVEFPSSDPGGLFQTWIYQDGSFIAGGGASPTGAILQINNLPYATGINWYQIVISRGGVSRTYDFWADADASAGLLNPNYGGADQSNALAIDNLAQVVTAALPSATEQYATSINIAPFNGGTLSMDPWLLQLVTDASIIAANPGTWLTPDAPALGTLSDSIFTNWGGSEQALAPNSTTDLADVTTGSLAFGWSGADQNWIGYNASIGNTNVVGSYTNKVSGLDIAQITFTGTAHNPITARADIDGKWVTADSNFANGTYQAVMTEYHFSLDAKTWVQVANPSETLQFTVDLSELDFIDTGGSFIQLDGAGGDTAGNWIRLEALGSTMPNGTLLVYATDTSGNLIGRDGATGAGVTLDDAVLARVGVVMSDSGDLLFNGAQSVYLEVGQQLRFAVQTGDGHVQMLPDVLVTGDQLLSVSVNGDFGTLNLSAAVDNTLSASSTAAESQRETDEPWIYLTQGERTHVDVVGSAFNINTIHFVRIDVDPATSDWSVGGVAYGDTHAFRAAVMASWDPGFQATGGRGNFSEGFDWTVSTGSGYYAPVLLTEGGDVFVIGKANADGMDHIRMFGENIFGFEDLRADQSSDFDYNDLVMHLSVL